MIHWLFVISVALFLSSIGFLLAGARGTPEGAPVEPSFTTPIASVKQIMNGITTPAATAVYNSVATIISVDGVEERFPKNDEEWEAVGNSAAALVETGNLLMMGNRIVDTGNWIKASQALIDAANVALQAVEAQDVEGLFISGAAINTACDECHQTYQVPSS